MSMHKWGPIWPSVMSMQIICTNGANDMHKRGLVVLGNLIKLGRFHTTATAVSGNNKLPTYSYK